MADGGLPPIETYLRSGQAFYGYQTNLPTPLTLKVEIREADLQRGVMSGTIERSIPPDENEENGLVWEVLPLIYWMCEIIENNNFGFLQEISTGSPAKELAEWDRFRAFCGFREEVEFNNGRSLDLESYPYTFMKLYEVDIVPDGTLSFPICYYLSMSRRLGEITGHSYSASTTLVSHIALFPL